MIEEKNSERVSSSPKSEASNSECSWARTQMLWSLGNHSLLHSALFLPHMLSLPVSHPVPPSCLYPVALSLLLRLVEETSLATLRCHFLKLNRKCSVNSIPTALLSSCWALPHSPGRVHTILTSFHLPTLSLLTWHPAPNSQKSLDTLSRGSRLRV